MTDNGIGIILIFAQELLSTRERYLVDIFVDILSCHTDSSIAHCESTFLGINRHSHLQLTKFIFIFTTRSKSLQLLCCIYGIRHKLTKENFVVAIQKLLNNGENIFSSYPNRSFLHHFLYCSFIVNR